VDQRRLERALVEKRRELVKDGVKGRFDQTEFAAVGTEEAAFVVDEVEQVELDASSTARLRLNRGRHIPTERQVGINSGGGGRGSGGRTSIDAEDPPGTERTGELRDRAADPARYANDSNVLALL
jgi:hypothetical protein